MKKMLIFEPAMCCSTGLCGVGVDSELLRISTVPSALEKNGIIVDRYNLTNAPQEFITNQVVNHLINEKGVDELPVILVDGEVVITGRYPTNDEIVKLFDIAINLTNEENVEECCTEDQSEGCCCCSDGECC